MADIRCSRESCKNNLNNTSGHRCDSIPMRAFPARPHLLISLHMEIRRLRGLVSFALADVAARRTFAHVTCLPSSFSSPVALFWVCYGLFNPSGKRRPMKYVPNPCAAADKHSPRWGRAVPFVAASNCHELRAHTFFTPQF